MRKLQPSFTNNKSGPHSIKDQCVISDYPIKHGMKFVKIPTENSNESICTRIVKIQNVLKKQTAIFTYML